MIFLTGYNNFAFICIQFHVIIFEPMDIIIWRVNFQVNLQFIYILAAVKRSSIICELSCSGSAHESAHLDKQTFFFL